MPAYTPFLNLYKMGGGSTGLITPDETVDVDRINQNMDAIDSNASSWGNPAQRNHQFYGSAAGLASITGMKRGDTYQESDGNFQTWRYDGSNWVSAEGGMYLIRPSSVVNGTINADGSISPSGSAASISFNGVFSSRYKQYRINYYRRTPVSVNDLMVLRNGGTDNTTANYSHQSHEANGGTTVAFRATNANNWSTNAPVVTNAWGEIEISNPMIALANALKVYKYSGGGYDANNPVYATRVGHLSGHDLSTFDGFTFFNTAPSNYEAASSWWKIYAFA